jgi:hypothetical protein
MLEILQKENGELKSLISESRTSRETVSESSDLRELINIQKQMLHRQYLSDLPSFSGNIEDFPAFYTAYKESSVLGNLDDSLKMSRLKQALKGVALNVVRRMLGTPSNADEVVEILRKRFGDSELLIKSKLKVLEDMASVVENKPSSVQEFFEFLKDMQMTLINCKAESYLRNPLLLENLERKLHPKFKHMWIKHKVIKGGNLGFDEFLAWMQVYYDVAIEEEPVASGKKSQVNVHSVSQSSSSGSKGPSKDLGCSYCGRQGHLVTDCFKFKGLNVKLKYDFLKSKGICFICLLGKHLSSNCREGKKCGEKGCNGNHHSLLHYGRNQGQSSKASEPVRAERGKGGEAGCSKDPFSTVVHSMVAESNTVLFQLLPVSLYNGKIKVDTWAFLDSGSSDTFLSNELAKSLNLKGKQCEIQLAWTDGSTQVERESELVSLKISGFNSLKRFSVKNVRTIKPQCLPQPDQDINGICQRFERLKDLKFPK